MRRRVLNSLRWAVTRRIPEPLLIRMVRGRRPRHPITRLLPNNYQYPPGTLRTVEREGVRLLVDLHDQIGWYVYFKIGDPDMERLRTMYRPGQVVVDVGANIGQTSMWAARMVGPTGRVLALEPHPGNYQRMLSNLALNNFTNITPIQVGLGETARTAMMDQPRPDNAGAHRVHPSGSTPVKLTTLDALDLDRVDVLKIDTEGYELRVLMGGRKTIARDRPLMFIEVHDGHLRDAGTSASELVAYIRDLGYRVTNADTAEPVLPESDFTDWFDVVCEPGV